ncbi:MAG: tRNA lysidine(34) synthetase TilS [Bacillales bacterium]|nr:tRNA lysidine(34) synthetase TilS [Bacillales bacterium]
MDKLIKDIELDSLFTKKEKIVIAVSTGIDSMSLFFYLYSLGYDLVVAHVNHKRRIESEKEYVFLKNYCDNLSVPFEGMELTGEIEGNFQAEARKKRYDFFKRVADKYETKKIVVAHQADDEAETVLMRIIKGSALRGYSGMKIVSVDDGYEIIRPLLYTSRKEIEDFEKNNNIPYFEDSSNSENHYMRNEIRHFLIPRIKEMNPDFLSSIRNFSKDVFEAYELVDSLTSSFIDKKALIEENSLSFKVADLEKEKKAVQDHIILKAINIITKDKVLATHERIEEIEKLAMSKDEGKVIEIKEDYVCYKEYGKLLFKRREENEKINLLISDFGDYLLTNGKTIIVSQKYHLLPNKNSYVLCYNDVKCVFPLTVRNFAPGDKIKVAGITKKVSDVLKEHKVPLRKRPNVLVLENKDGIFFIPGILRKEKSEGKNTLYITYVGGDEYDNG